MAKFFVGVFRVGTRVSLSLFKCYSWAKQYDIDSMIVIKPMSVKVSPKYQVVIPEEVRKSLNITPGMQISVIAKGGIAYLIPFKSVGEVAKRLSGKMHSSEKKRLQKSLREKRDRKI